MSITSFRSVSAVLTFFLSATAALAGADDYRFELVSTEHRVGSGAMVEVRLTDARTGAPVEGAVIFATRMDMAPEGMEMMTTPITLLPPGAQGHYRFATDLTMAGGWRLSVAAKVPDEQETVEARIELTVQP